MAKSFKKLFSEVADPKSGGEKAFKAQHVIQRYDAQPAGQDFIFNGEQPPRKRLADYAPGQDAAVYDRAYRPDDGDGSITDTTNGPVAVESFMAEDPGQEKPMMMGQLRAMAHNLQGIARYVSTTQDPEEWFQNKLAGVAREMQTLYGYATAETMAMGESVLEEASCGCGPDCEHCGGDHSEAEVGEKCDCCGNMVKEDTDHKVDGRRLSFKEKAAKLGYVKKENAFVAKIAKKKLAGEKKMVMGNKEYPVTMKKANAEKIDKELDESVDISKLSPDQLAKLDKLMTSLAKGNLSDAEKEKAIKAAMTDMGVMKEETELNEGILETLALIWFAGKVLPIIVGVSLMAVAGGLLGLVKLLDKISAIKQALKDKKVKAFIKKNKGKPIDAKMKAEIQKLFPPRVADKIRDELEAKGAIKEGLYEAQAEWLVTFKTGHKPQKVKGRNTAEAIKKAEKAAEKSGEKDPRLKAMYKNIEKIEESTDYLTELDSKTQKKFVAGAKAMKSYAQKNGGVDKADFMKVAKMMDDIARVNILQAGSILARLNREVDGMDTDVRERIYAELKKVGLVESLEEKKETKRKLTPKEMRRALATAKAAPKDKVSLKKAPFDIPKEEVDLEEKFTIKTSILPLDSGEKVKVTRQDADLLNKFFRSLNPRNSDEMRKVLVKDKAGYEEILGFAREAL